MYFLFTFYIFVHIVMRSAIFNAISDWPKGGGWGAFEVCFSFFFFFLCSYKRIKKKLIISTLLVVWPLSKKKKTSQKEKKTKDLVKNNNNNDFKKCKKRSKVYDEHSSNFFFCVCTFYLYHKVVGLYEMARPKIKKVFFSFFVFPFRSFIFV